jgi:uncharacterized Zn finger protein
VRNGSVLDLQITPGQVTALVNGSELYRIAISIEQVPAAAWRRICADCAGRIDSVVELLQGRLSKGVMERLCRQEDGLFPRPSDIRFACSCPDHASLCKHVAAVLYGVGARLDHEPELLFRLRAVDEAELVAGLGTGLPMAEATPAAGKVLQTDDVAALFGLDMAATVPAADPQRRKSRPPRVPHTPAASKPPPRVAEPTRSGKAGAARPGKSGKATAARVVEKRTPAASRKGAAKVGPAAGPSTAERRAARAPEAGKPRAVVGGGRAPATAPDEPAGSRRRAATPRPRPKSRSSRAR